MGRLKLICFLIPLALLVTLGAVAQNEQQPPAAVTSLTTQQGDGVVTLLWKPSTSTDVASYSVYRDGAPIEELTDLPAGEIPTIILGGVTFLYIYDTFSVSNRTQYDQTPYTYFIRPKNIVGIQQTAGNATAQAVPHAAYPEGASLIEAGPRTVDQKGMGDFNKDGYPDFVGWNAYGGLKASISDPLSPPGSYEAVSISEDVAIGVNDVLARDFNGDGILDVAYCTINTEGQSVIRIIKGIIDEQQLVSFLPWTDINLSPMDADPMHISTADLDHNGLPDFIILGDEDIPLWQALNHSDRGTSSPSFSTVSSAGFTLPPQSPIPDFKPFRNLIVGDLNGDSYPDLVLGLALANSEEPETFAFIALPNIVLINNKGQGFQEVPQPAWPVEGFATLTLSLVDLDADGSYDLLEGVANDAMRLYRGHGDGTFDAPEAFGPSSAESIVAGDLDHDGDMDVVVADRMIYMVIDPNCTPRPPRICRRTPMVATANIVLRNIRVNTSGTTYKGYLFNAGERINTDLVAAVPIIALADFDRDYDLDFLTHPLIDVHGGVSITPAEIFYSQENAFTCTGSNDAPFAPINPTVKQLAEEYDITWSLPLPADDKTPPDALTYNVIVTDLSNGLLYGSEPGETSAPQVGVSDHFGEAGNARTFTIHRPSQGNPSGIDLGSGFKVKVQSVDGQKDLSGWAEIVYNPSSVLTPPTLDSATFSSGNVDNLTLEISQKGGGPSGYSYTLYYGAASGTYTGKKTGISVPSGTCPCTIAPFPFYGWSCGTVYFALVSVDSNGNESTFSNEVVSNAYEALALSVQALTAFGANTALTAGTVWTITTALSLSTAQTLTIEPGTILKFLGSNASLTINGILHAQGDPCRKIIFTSLNDDTVGGDTPGGTAPAGAPGDWKYVRIGAAAQTDPITNWELRFGGHTANDGNLWVEASSTQTRNLRNVISSSSGDHGIVLETAASAQPFVLNNLQASNNTKAGLYLKGSGNLFIGSAGSGLAATATNNTNSLWGQAVLVANGTTPVPRTAFSLTATGNTVNGVVLGESTPNTLGDLLLANPGIPYVVPAGCTVTAHDLTAEPGVIVKFANTTSILKSTGDFTAIGTSGQHVTFTSINDPIGGQTIPSPPALSKGSWGYVQTSSPRSTILKRADFLYGGFGNTGMVEAQLKDSASTTIVDSSFGFSLSSGLWLRGRGTGLAPLPVTLENISTHDNNSLPAGTSTSLGGLYVSRTSSSFSTPISLASASGEAFSLTSTNDYSPMVVDFPSMLDHVGDITATGDSVPAVVLLNSWNVPSALDVRFGKMGVPYLLQQSVSLSGAKLTLDSGVIFKGHPLASQKPYIQTTGSLDASGTAEEPIILTSGYDTLRGGALPGLSGTPQPGDWGILKWVPPAGAQVTCHLSHLKAFYGGIWGSYVSPQIYLWEREAATTSLDWVESQFSLGAGMVFRSYRTDSAPEFRNCTFANNLSDGLQLPTPIQKLTLRWGNFFGNGGSPIQGGGNDVDAVSCFWGVDDLDGIQVTPSPTPGTLISPWLMAPVTVDQDIQPLLWTGDFNPNGGTAYKATAHLVVAAPSARTWNWALVDPNPQQGKPVPPSGTVTNQSTLDWIWDGMDETGTIKVWDGKYILTVTDGSGQAQFPSFRADVWVNSTLYFALTQPAAGGLTGNLVNPSGDTYRGILDAPSGVTFHTYFEDWSERTGQRTLRFPVDSDKGSAGNPVNLGNNPMVFGSNGQHRVEWYGNSVNTSGFRNAARVLRLDPQAYEQANIFVRVATASQDLNRNTCPGCTIVVETDATGLVYPFEETLTLYRRRYQPIQNANYCSPMCYTGYICYPDNWLEPAPSDQVVKEYPPITISPTPGDNLSTVSWDGTVAGAPSPSGLYAAKMHIRVTLSDQVEHTVDFPTPQGNDYHFTEEQLAWDHHDGVTRWSVVDTSDRCLASGSLGGCLTGIGAFSYGSNLLLKLTPAPSYGLGVATVLAGIYGTHDELDTYLEPFDALRPDTDPDMPRAWYWDGVFHSHQIVNPYLMDYNLLIAYSSRPEGSLCGGNLWGNMMKAKIEEFSLSGFYYLDPRVRICQDGSGDWAADYSLVRDGASVTARIWAIGVGVPGPVEPLAAFGLGTLGKGSYSWPGTADTEAQTTLRALPPGYYEIELSASDSNGYGNTAKQTFQMGW